MIEGLPTLWHFLASVFAYTFETKPEMNTPFISVIIPLIILLALVIVGARIKAKSKFLLPVEPHWPDAENPGLAMELARPEDVDRILGTGDTKVGSANRHTAIEIQKLDRIFVPLYVGLFVAVALRFPGIGWQLGVIVAAVFAGVFDYLEDYQIIRLAKGEPSSSARPFGQAKWFFYFLANGLSSALLIPPQNLSLGKATALWIVGLLLFGTGLVGTLYSLRASFNGIRSTAKVSMVGLLGLALAPLISQFPFSFTVTAEYLICCGFHCSSRPRSFHCLSWEWLTGRHCAPF